MEISFRDLTILSLFCFNSVATLSIYRPDYQPFTISFFDAEARILTAKGLVELVKGVMKEAGHVHCSYHRRKNILTYKPIGAAPGCDYYLLKICVVAKRLVRTTINLVGTLHVCTS